MDWSSHNWAVTRKEWPVLLPPRFPQLPGPPGRLRRYQRSRHVCDVPHHRGEKPENLRVIHYIKSSFRSVHQITRVLFRLSQNISFIKYLGTDHVNPILCLQLNIACTRSTANGQAAPPPARLCRPQASASTQPRQNTRPAGRRELQTPDAKARAIAGEVAEENQRDSRGLDATPEAARPGVASGPGAMHVTKHSVPNTGLHGPAAPRCRLTLGEGQTSNAERQDGRCGVTAVLAAATAKGEKPRAGPALSGREVPAS